MASENELRREVRRPGPPSTGLRGHFLWQAFATPTPPSKAQSGLATPSVLPAGVPLSENQTRSL